MEKKDKLADFMRENRELFDDRAPSPELWDNISRQLNTGSRKRRSLAVNWLSGAAAALVLTLLVPTVWYFTNDGLQSYDTSLSGEIFEITNYYETQIEEKIQLVSTLSANEPSIRTELDADLERLDQVLAELKEDLKDGVANREVISAMIQNYRMKLSILEQVLEYVDNSQYNSDQENEIEYQL